MFESVWYCDEKPQARCSSSPPLSGNAEGQTEVMPLIEENDARALEVPPLSTFTQGAGGDALGGCSSADFYPPTTPFQTHTTHTPHTTAPVGGSRRRLLGEAKTCGEEKKTLPRRHGGRYR